MGATTGTTISSTYFAGVTLTQAAYNPVLVTGTITVASGVALYGGGGIDWTVTNAGLIRSDDLGTSGGYGVSLTAGGMLTNQSGGIIDGYQGGVRIGGAAGTLTNEGLITASGTAADAVNLLSGGAVTNALHATIAGYAAVFGSAGVTVTNAGALSGTSFGVLLPGGGAVTNQSTGTIAASSGSANAVQLANTVVNDGQISAAGYGVFGASYVDNQSQGRIAGAAGGVHMSAGTLINAGSVAAYGAYGTGVFLQTNGMVSNELNAAISASGLGINFAANVGTAVNDGLINGGSIGVDHATAVTNQSNGTINGGNDGLLITSGTVVNAGSITGATGIQVQGSVPVLNQTGGVIAGSNLGINISGAAGTVENAGTITGGTDAISFGANYTNRLIVDPGASFSGIVDGGGSGSTLELAGGGAGSLTELGVRYIGFPQITIDAGGIWTLTGGNTLAAGVTLSGAGLTLAAGATLELAGSVAAGETIWFGGGGADLVLDTTASMAGAVANLQPGETIDLRGVGPASVSYAAGRLDYTASGGGAASFALSLGSGTSGIATPTGDGAGGADITALCFCAGTMLATPDGEVPVEDLSVGVRVLTASGEARPIAWIGVGRVLASRGRRSAATPVIVRKGALADNVPHHDLRVTKGHALALDGVLIPVEFLVNHRTILWDDGAQETALYHIELDRHDVLLANGAPAESYRDDGNRWLFQNANSGWGLPPLPPCAPVLTGGPIVDAVWRRLLDRAGARPGVPLTDDPDLHLLVGGRRIDACFRHGPIHAFRLPARLADVRIVSRSVVPQELGLARDARELGVALRRLVLRDGTRLRVIRVDDDRLSEGFHAYEADNHVRWSNGDALLPAGLFVDAALPLELELHLGCGTRYPADAAVRQAA
jgi:hypothetical protein